MTVKKAENPHECLIKIVDLAGGSQTCVKVGYVQVFLQTLKIILLDKPKNCDFLKYEIEQFEKQIIIKE